MQRGVGHGFGFRVESTALATKGQSLLLILGTTLLLNVKKDLLILGKTLLLKVKKDHGVHIVENWAHN